jgi:hypothetical protein
LQDGEQGIRSGESAIAMHVDVRRLHSVQHRQSSQLSYLPFSHRDSDYPPCPVYRQSSSVTKLNKITKTPGLKDDAGR